MLHVEIFAYIYLNILLKLIVTVSFYFILMWHGVALPYSGYQKI